MCYLSTLAFDEDFLDLVRAVAPGVVVQQITANSAADIPAALWAQVDVLHTSTIFPPAGVATSIRWIQLDTSGADHLSGQPVWRSAASITTLGGVGPVAMAEYAIFALLGMAHRLPALIAARNNRSWPAAGVAAQLFTPAPVRGTTMAIIGYGRIGQEIGRGAAAFGISVIGVSRGGPAVVDPATARYDGRQVVARPLPLGAQGVDPGAPIEPDSDRVLVVDTSRLRLCTDDGPMSAPATRPRRKLSMSAPSIALRTEAGRNALSA